VPTTAATPYKTGSDGKPITWTGATPHSSPGKPGDPTTITVAMETVNYPIDQGLPPFTHPLPSEFVPLLDAAEKTWELYANIQFITAPDAASSTQSADIRVGMAFLNHPPTVNELGVTFSRWYTTTDKFLPDTTVKVEDPAETPITKLPNGDYRHNGFESTTFQDLLHELGHALGLDHNSNDLTSIMYPVATLNNLVPDAQDIAAIQTIYGAPKPVLLTQSDVTILNGLHIPAHFV
jgi:hypothetical protein